MEATGNGKPQENQELNPTSNPSASSGRTSRGTQKSMLSKTSPLHARNCKVCANPRREEIERDILNWRSPQEIVKEYKLGNRKAVYRHAHALGLMDKRYGNLRAALGRIIERAGEVPATAWSVVAAVRTCAKINARGQWVEEESSELRELLDGMTHEELLAYAENGTVPEWFGGTGLTVTSDE